MVARESLGYAFCPVCQAETIPDERSGRCLWCDAQLVPPKRRRRVSRRPAGHPVPQRDSRAGRRYDRCRARLAQDGLSLSFRCTRRAAVDVNGAGMCQQHAARAADGKVVLFPEGA